MEWAKDALYKTIKKRNILKIGKWNVRAKQKRRAN